MANRHSRAAKIVGVVAGACMLCLVGWGMQSAPGSSSKPAEPEPRLSSNGANPVLRFAVGHGHAVGFCLGYLYISRDTVRFEAAGPEGNRSHGFEVPRSDIVGMGHWKGPLGMGPKNWAALKLRNGTQYSLLHVLPRNVESGTGGAGGVASLHRSGGRLQQF